MRFSARAKADFYHAVEHLGKVAAWSYFKAGRWNILKSQAFTPIIDAYV